MRPRINLMYVVAVLLMVLLYFMYVNVQTDSAFFYGFAENKETEISHDKDVLIERILVTPGQQVKAGDLLMVVKNTTIPRKINELKLKKEVIRVGDLQDASKINYKISELRIEKFNKLEEVTAKINELNKEIELNKSMFEGLKSLETETVSSAKSPKQIQVDFLVEKMTNVSNHYDNEILYHEKLLQTVNKPSGIKRDIIDSEIKKFVEEQGKLSIYAPSDGLVGSVLCKEKENISSFSTLLNFYKINPTLVKGYVHESLLLHVKIGDELQVSSSMHTQHKVKGKVIGLGSRIVEIPERLRKIPDFKTYGREVTIRISHENEFLQKEKVMLQTMEAKNNYSWKRIFRFPSSGAKAQK